jgi:hypothetical protein
MRSSSEDANLIVGRNGRNTGFQKSAFGKNLMIAHLNRVTTVFKEMQLQRIETF